MSEKMSKFLLAAMVALAGAAEGAAPFRVSREAMPKICVEPGLRPFVTRAAEDLAGDLEKIFGARPEIVSAAPETNAIVLAKAGSGWERYELRSERGNVLRIVGSDDRGVMFGAYRFCEEFLGVDPFYRWSGLFPAKAESRTWPSVALVQDEPSFRFRGWFINDEDFLNGFHVETQGTRPIDYKRYQVVFGPDIAEMVYETAVRAGFNTVICASYVDILNPPERRLVEIASGRGLYITTHHQEPVGASGWLWKNRCKAKGLATPTTYAEDPDGMRAFWKEHVEAWAKVPDVIWQIGLRGVGDRPFWLKEGQWDDANDRQDENLRRAGLISQAMRDQLGLITAALGHAPEHVATQLWMEGAELYQRGMLDIPKGTLVIYSDNCPGWKFQSDLGTKDRLDPSSAYGLYYHLALVHGNHWTECVPPVRTHQVLGDAWRKGAREFVLFNVSNVRQFLYTIHAAGAMTRDLPGFDADRFREDWIARRFTANRAALSRALELYYNAFETVDSRDASSSYGSPFARAPIAMFNDGTLFALVKKALNGGCAVGKPVPPPEPVVSKYVSDPAAQTRRDDDMRRRTTADMFPDLVSRVESVKRASAQLAGFERVLLELSGAREPLPAAEALYRFDRFEFPTRFMALATRMYIAAALAAEARGAGDLDACLRHLDDGIVAAEERDALARQYCHGTWEHWFDRSLIYPYGTLADLFRQKRKGLAKKGK